MFPRASHSVFSRLMSSFSIPSPLLCHRVWSAVFSDYNLAFTWGCFSLPQVNFLSNITRSQHPPASLNLAQPLAWEHRHHPLNQTSSLKLVAGRVSPPLLPSFFSPTHPQLPCRTCGIVSLFPPPPLPWGSSCWFWPSGEEWMVLGVPIFFFHQMSAL